MTTPTFAVLEDLAPNAVLLDSVSGAGKVVLSSILSSLEGTEHTQVVPWLEQTVIATALGALTTDCAASLLRLRINETAYNTAIGRHVNFRLGDYSSIHNAREPRRYFDRLSQPDGDQVVQHLRADRPLFLFQTHDLLVNLDTLERVGVSYRLVEVIRSPVDMAYSWWKRGWGERFGADPRAFTLTLQHGDVQIPWYCRDFADEWLELPAADRCVRLVCSLLERSIAQYRQASTETRAKICWVSFEGFLGDPQAGVDALCRFLGTARSVWTDGVIRRDAQSPNLAPEVKARKVREFRDATRPATFEALMALDQAVRTNAFELT